MAVVGASLDASSAWATTASTVALNPLGRNGIHEDGWWPCGEMKAFGWLVDQLPRCLSGKTVVLFSPELPARRTRRITEGR